MEDKSDLHGTGSKALVSYLEDNSEIQLPVTHTPCHNANIIALAQRRAVKILNRSPQLVTKNAQETKPTIKMTNIGLLEDLTQSQVLMNLNKIYSRTAQSQLLLLFMKIS